MKNLLFIFISLIAIKQLSANNLTPDSLEHNLKTAKHDTMRLRILDAMAIAENDPKIEIGYNKQIEALTKKNLATNPPLFIKNIYRKFLANAIYRKGLIYNNLGDYINALDYYFISLKIREELGDNIGISKSLNNIGNIYADQGDIPKALTYYNKSLNLRKKLGDKNGISSSLNNIGNIYADQGDIPKALEYYNKSLKIFEEIGDKQGMASSFNNIGAIYYNQRDFHKALEYYNKSLILFEEFEDKSSISFSLNNIGLIFAQQAIKANTLQNIVLRDSLRKQAIEYNNKSLKIREKIGDKNGMAYSLNNLGSIYYEQASTANSQHDIVRNDTLFKRALEYYKKSLKIFEETGDKSGMSASLNYIGNIYFINKQTKHALDYAKKAYYLAKEIGYVDRIKEAAKLLEEIYAKQGNYKLSRQYFGEYVDLSDSISKDENQKLTQKNYFQYQYEKKAATDSITYSKAMDIKNIEIKRQEAISSKQKIVIGFVVIGLVLLLFFLVFLYKLFVQKKKANMKLILQTEEIRQQKEEITTQRDEIESQNIKLNEQNHLLEEHKKEITDSITYAKQIQQAVLPDDEFMKKILPEYFVLFKPQNIVSGDFYWATKTNNLLIVCVADCTGHGVPGAFMSMLGISFLNEIVLKNKITKASEILEQLRISIIHALKQTGQSGEQKDGMDITIVVINMETLEMQFAGANNPLYIVSCCKLQVMQPATCNSQLDERNKHFELYELKGDKQPVGIYENMKPFTNRITNLQKGDTIYLASDGYEDQFGGTNIVSGGKKFKSKQLKELLAANYHQPMVAQKEILEKTINEWMDNLPQVDDICIMGIRI